MRHDEENIGTPGSDEHQISRLLGGLKRVEAPKDFDFHLKARIANARPESYRPTGLLSILKYAVPLGLFLAVGAGIFLYTANDPRLNDDMVQVPAAAASSNSPIPIAPDEPKPEVRAADESVIVASASPERPDSRKENAEPLVASTSPEAVTERPNRGGSRDFTSSGDPDRRGNSADLTVRAAETPRTPRGLSSLNPVGVKDALRMMDAEASFEDNAWVVISVRANGIADQLGMKAGDRLKSIDGKPVGERTEFQSSFSATTIQVLRGDATIDLGKKQQ
ncbi:MAG: PDZ domain-containing protein [Pyrinomonadaceae bacterium]